MDGHRFDEFAKTLARGRLTRRGALKALGGGLLGGVLGTRTAAHASAYVCRAGGVLCLADADCCSGGCDQTTHRCTPACRGAGHPCEGNQDCCAGLTCAASGPGAALRCTAPTATTTTTAACLPAGSPCGGAGQVCCGVCCGGTCADTSSDVHNCGGCGTTCHLNETCVGGVCTCGTVVCSAGNSCCAGVNSCQCAPPAGGGYALPGYPSGCAGSIGSCPAGTTACVGPSCQACCPTGSTCDTANGTCFVP